MSLLNYILESSLALTLLRVAYLLLLKNQTQFSVRRFFLLGAVAVSAFLPLIHLPAPSTGKLLPSAEQVIPTTWLPELVVGTAPESLKTDWWGGVWIGYATIGLVTLACFVFQILRMVMFIRKCEKYKWQRCWVTESKEHKPTFSFFHFIFLGQAHQLSPDDKREILQHESIHVKRLHSVDIVLISLVKIIWWFHPVTYFIHQELTRLHEFEADEESVKNKDITAYCELLAKMALQDAGLRLGSRFTNSLIIKRINMMKTSKQNLRGWRIAAIACVTIALITFIGCQDQFTSKENKIDESELPEDLATHLKRLRMISPKSEFIVLRFRDGEQIDEYQKSHPKAAFPFVSVGTNNYAIVEPNGIVETIPKNENEVFSSVDEMATPVFGINSLYKNLAHTIKYPLTARKNGTQGKVFIQFVVQTDGTLTDIKVIRGVDDEIDTEALRAFYQLKDKWYPAIHKGQIVKMQMVMPIVFKLDDTLDKADASTIENSMEALVAVGKKIR